MANNNQSKSVNAKKQKKWRALLITLITLSILGILVIGHFLYKGCSPSGPTKSLNIKIIQPTVETWVLKVNGEENNLRVNQGDQLNVIVEPRKSSKDILSYYTDEKQDNISSNANAYYVKVTSEKEPTKQIGKSGQLFYDEATQRYSVSFFVGWDVDAILQIDEKTNFEDSIYTKDEATGNVIYTYDWTLFDSTQDIRRMNNTTTPATEEHKPRDEFDDPLWIGSEIQVLYANFLSQCTIFNSKITFNEGILTTIEDNFLWGCEKFNQQITFPDSLTTINGNFMKNCKKFNQPINTNKIQHIKGDQGNSTFLQDCDDFDSIVTFGSSLKTMPDGFLMSCKKYNQPITIPSTVEHVGNYFLYGCDIMQKNITVECKPSAFKYESDYICGTSNPDALCYTQGMKIAGTYADEWVGWFEEVNDPEKGIYRKVVKAQ